MDVSVNIGFNDVVHGFLGKGKGGFSGVQGLTGSRTLKTAFGS